MESAALVEICCAIIDRLSAMKGGRRFTWRMPYFSTSPRMAESNLRWAMAESAPSCSHLSASTTLLDSTLVLLLTTHVLPSPFSSPKVQSPQGPQASCLNLF